MKSRPIGFDLFLSSNSAFMASEMAFLASSGDFAATTFWRWRYARPREDGDIVSILHAGAPAAPAAPAAGWPPRCARRRPGVASAATTSVRMVGVISKLWLEG